jgi:hypothetical protein
MTDEQLIEAMVARIRANTSWLLAEEAAQIATAALAKVDEVYHRIPKDQEPDAWVKPNWQDPANYDGTSPVTVYPRADWTPLYALEKRHD